MDSIRESDVCKRSESLVVLLSKALNFEAMVLSKAYTKLNNICCTYLTNFLTVYAVTSFPFIKFTIGKTLVKNRMRLTMLNIVI